MANPLMNNSDPWAWNQAAQQQDPGLYGWNKYGIDASSLSFGPTQELLRNAGLWRPEFDQYLQDKAQAMGNGDADGVMPQAPDLSSLAGYQYGDARSQGYDRLQGLFGPDGAMVGNGLVGQTQGFKGRDYMEGIGTALAPIAIGAGLGAAGIGPGIGGLFGAGEAAAGSGAFLGEGIASGIPAWDAAGGAALGGGETAALGAGQVGAMGGGFGAPGAEGLGGITGGGGLTGSGASLYAPGGFAGGTGSALSGASSGGGGGLLGGLGSLFSGGSGGGMSLGNWLQLGQGALGLYGNQRAIGAAQDATNQANQTAQSIYNQQRQDNMPLMQTRDSALGKINALLANPSSVTQEPGYQFGLEQGQKQLDNNAAATGAYYSGGQQKAAARYNQDYASTKFDQSLNRLTNLAGMGQVGANNNGNALASYGQQTSQNALNMGNFRGSGYAGSANGIGNALGSVANDWQTQQYLQQLGRKP